MYNVASRAVLCYNRRVKNVLPSRYWKYPMAWIASDWRCIVNNIPQDTTPCKQCNKCKVSFPATTDFFYRDASKKDKLATFCKDCKRPKKTAPVENTRSGYKICGKCHQEKPATPEYFSRDKYGKGGLCSQCKQCRSTRKPNDVPQGYKKCLGCNSILPATTEYFHASANGKNGLNCRCKPCRLAIIDREKKRVYDLERYHNNRERCSEVSKKYRQTERGIIAKRARAHNRRARKRNAVGTHTTEELYQQLKRQKGKCYYCKVKLGKGRDSWNGDHIIPLSKGGTNDIANIVISCPSCNFKKGTKRLHEWDGGGRLL